MLTSTLFKQIMLLSPLVSLANSPSLRRFAHRQILNCQYTTKSSSKVRLFMRNLSSSSTSDDNNGINGSTKGSSDILKSTAATTQWKRKHYQTIEDKFQSNKDTTINTTNTPNSNESADDINQSKDKDEPLSIESYEDVQPMWKEMESRVTKRRSLTLDERKGISGRRNIRKSDEDVWLSAGVYDDEGSSEDSSKDDEKD